jgi:hypothetical protein
MGSRSLQGRRSCGCLIAPIALGLLINLTVGFSSYDFFEVALALLIIWAFLRGFDAFRWSSTTRAPLLLILAVVAVGMLLTLLSFSSHILPCIGLIYLLFFDILHRSAAHDGASKAARYMRSCQVLVFLLPLNFVFESVIPAGHQAAMTAVLAATWMLMIGAYTVLAVREWSTIWKTLPSNGPPPQQGRAEGESHGF